MEHTFWKSSSFCCAICCCHLFAKFPFFGEDIVSVTTEDLTGSGVEVTEETVAAVVAVVVVGLFTSLNS